MPKEYCERCKTNNHELIRNTFPSRISPFCRSYFSFSRIKNNPKQDLCKNDQILVCCLPRTEAGISGFSWSIPPFVVVFSSPSSLNKQKIPRKLRPIAAGQEEDGRQSVGHCPLCLCVLISSSWSGNRSRGDRAAAAAY